MEIFEIPVLELLARAKTGVRLFPDISSMLDHMASSMADELRANNAADRPTRWILPVGPVRQYFRLVETCNRERLSWSNADIFQMDEFLDWQGSPLPLSHPLSFEGFMRSQVFETLAPNSARILSASTFRIHSIPMKWRSGWPRPAASIPATAASAITATG